MRKTVGYFTLLAAVILVVCSAATLFWSAYDGAADPWQKWVQGTQIVCVIIWEAGALVAISYCARHPFPGRGVVVIGGSVLLLLAMGYTLTQELRQQAGAQESASTVREAQNGKLELVRSELDKAIARRDALQKMPKLSIAQQNELATVRREISSLKDKWEAQVEAPHAALAPGVALIARWTGLNMNDSADLDPLIKMAFWTMARVFALPLALFAIALMGASTLPVQAREAQKGMDVAPLASSPLLTRSARPEMGRHPLLQKAMAVAAVNSSEIPNGSPDDTPPPADAKPVAEGPGNGGGGTPVKVAGPVLVTEDWKPEQSKPLSKKQRKQMERERLKDDAVRAVEEFAAAKLDLDSLGARFLRTGKGFVQSGGTSGTQLGKEFRQWAKSTRKWAHFATYDKNPLGKALSAVLEAGRPTSGGGSVYAALVKQEQRRAAA